MAKAARRARSRKSRYNAQVSAARTRAMLALDEAPGHLLRRCHQRSREIYEGLIGRHGLSRQQFAVLIAMHGNPGANLTGISAVTGFDRNTLAEMIGRLARQGYVTCRRSKADARAFAIALAPKGARFVAGMMPKAHAVQQQILAPLPPALRPIFVHCLRVLLGLDPPEEGGALARMTPGAPCSPLLPASAAAPAAANGELRALEESLWRRETRADRGYMERTLAPDFFEFGRSGRVYTREDIIGTTEMPADYALRDLKVTPLDDGVALVTYASEVRGREVVRGNRSSVWRKTRQGWQLSFHQGTAVFPDGGVPD
jgi:MarR family transcriptional regulator, lower aerobic nicotinate degradation pathway regulator